MPTLVQTNNAPLRYRKVHVTAAELVAIGAAVSGTLQLGFSLPPKAVVVAVGAFNGGVAAATLATLTVQVGDAGDPNRYLDAQTVFAANAGLMQQGVDFNTNNSATADTPVTALFTGDANLSTLTGLTDGVDIIMYYLEA